MTLIELRLTPAEFHLVYDACLALRDDYEHYKERLHDVDPAGKVSVAIDRLCERLHKIEQTVVHPH